MGSLQRLPLLQESSCTVVAIANKVALSVMSNYETIEVWDDNKRKHSHPVHHWHLVRWKLGWGNHKIGIGRDDGIASIISLPTKIKR